MDFLSAMNQSYYDCHEILAGAIEGGERVDGNGWVIINSGWPVEEFNIACLTAGSSPVETRIQQIDDYFRSRKTPYRLIVQHSDDILKATTAAGYYEKERSPGMSLLKFPHDLTSRHQHPALKVISVEHRDQVEVFGRLAFECFGFPTDAASFVINQQLVATPRCKLFIGFLNDIAIATAMAYIGPQQCVAPKWIATHKDYRRQGFGEIMTWRAIAAGADNGCQWAGLEASTQGLPVYEQMGFKTVTQYLSLLPSEAIAP